MTVIPIVSGALGTISKGLVKGQENLKIRGVKTIQTTAFIRSARVKNPGDLKRFAVTKTPVRNHR